MKDKLQEKPLALKRENPALQNMIFFYFFLYLWLVFVLLDPNLDPHFGSGSSNSNYCGSMRIRIHNPGEGSYHSLFTVETMLISEAHDTVLVLRICFEFLFPDLSHLFLGKRGGKSFIVKFCLQDCDETEVSILCLEGIRCAIRYRIHTAVCATLIYGRKGAIFSRLNVHC
jgi:hypothetical protein